MRPESSGKIILLNGATSSGKTSIAQSVQARIDLPFWHISIDHLRDAGVLPMTRYRRGEFKWADWRDAFFDGFEESLAAYARCGNNLIVEYIVETKERMRGLVQCLGAYDMFFVGVHCGLPELRRREFERADRPIGGAERDYDTVHAHCIYDLELDGELAADVNADRLIAAWRSREKPSAFDKLATKGS